MGCCPTYDSTSLKVICIYRIIILHTHERRDIGQNVHIKVIALKHKTIDNLSGLFLRTLPKLKQVSIIFRRSADVGF